MIEGYLRSKFEDMEKCEYEEAIVELTELYRIKFGRYPASRSSLMADKLIMAINADKLIEDSKSGVVFPVTTLEEADRYMYGEMLADGGKSRCDKYFEEIEELRVLVPKDLRYNSAQVCMVVANYYHQCKLELSAEKSDSSFRCVKEFMQEKSDSEILVEMLGHTASMSYPTMDKAIKFLLKEMTLSNHQYVAKWFENEVIELKKLLPNYIVKVYGNSEVIVAYYYEFCMAITNRLERKSDYAEVKKFMLERHSREIKKASSSEAVTAMFTAENFLSGKYSINCKTADEAIKLFRWLRSRGVIWKTNSPLTSTNWKEYKEETTYLIQPDVGLAVWTACGTEAGKLIRYSEVAEQLVPKPLEFPPGVTIRTLNDKYAIWCETEEEAEDLFEKLGKLGVLRGEGSRECEKGHTVWFMQESKTAYTVLEDRESKLRLFNGNVEHMAKLGYRIIKGSVLPDAGPIEN